MLGISKFCHNTPLLNAMKIHSIQTTIETQQMTLMKSIFNNGSRARTFYSHCMKQKSTNCSYQNELLDDISKTCQKYDISLIRYLLDDSYTLLSNRKMKVFCDDGLVDSIRQCLYALNDTNRTLVNLLLSPF